MVDWDRIDKGMSAFRGHGIDRGGGGLLPGEPHLLKGGGKRVE